MTKTDRITWIDAGKGIGIFLVIIGHSTLIGQPRNQIYAFHMPLFFFLSGILFSTKKYPQFKNFLQAKAKSLLIPYFAFSIISILLYEYFQRVPFDYKKFISVTVISKRNSIYFNEALWFLTALFVVEILFYFIVKIKNRYAILGVSLLIGFLSNILFNPLAGTHILPWSLDQSMFFLMYFGLGYFVKNTNILKGDLRKSRILIPLSILYLWLVYDPTYYHKAFALLNLPYSLFVYFNHLIWASLAIAFVLYLSQFLAYSPLVTYIGFNSLNLMVLHLCLGFNLFARYFRAGLNLEDHPNILALFYTAGSILILLPFCYIINKYLPILHGKKLRFHLPRTTHGGA